MATEILPAAEFQALPLEFIISAPLNGAVKAQAIAADNLRAFLEAFKDKTVEFKTSASQTTGATPSNGAGQQLSVSVPLLAVVPVPYLRIDSLTASFKYEISQIVMDKSQTEKGVDLDAGTAGFLSNFVRATVKGSVSSKSSSESTLNRSGSLEITVHASEAPIPEGLARVLSLLAHAVPPPPA
jgi:hypothetical protein